MTRPDDANQTNPNADSLDSGDDGTRPVVELSGAEALQRIKEGKPVSNVRIVGLTFRSEFTGEIKMENVTLVRPRFTQATFLGPVGFLRCSLIRPTIGNGTVFKRGLNLRGSTVRHGTFRNVTCCDSLRCDNVRFAGQLRVEKCRFEGTVRFWDARFEGWAEFLACEFATHADFRNFHAEEGLAFSKCRFAGDMLFRGSTVSKKLDFGDSRFEGLVDLSKAKLHDFVYLERIEQGDEQQFAFANAVADRILVRPEQLEGRIRSENEKNHAAAMQEFGLLKRNFETLNRYEDDDWAFYRFKVNQRRSRPVSLLRPLRPLMRLADWVFLDLGCGYGTNPFRAVRSALVMIFLFALIYMAGIQRFVGESPLLAEQPVSLANRALFAVMTSISVFTAGFTGEHLNSAEGWLLFPLGVEALLGTLLWGLFIVAFSRKVIR
ncbi:MAG: hypothetical protein GXX96_17705 [Planctomycetaceae bacterium]|nr:hypothetical protein [Planctomycetaceae bacterium]